MNYWTRASNLHLNNKLYSIGDQLCKNVLHQQMNCLVNLHF